MDTKETTTTGQAAKRLGMSSRTLYRWDRWVNGQRAKPPGGHRWPGCGDGLAGRGGQRRLGGVRRVAGVDHRARSHFDAEVHHPKTTLHHVLGFVNPLRFDQ
jgi:hypothetical protein